LTLFLYLFFFFLSENFEFTADGEKQNDRLDGRSDEVKKLEKRVGDWPRKLL
jgi:hypothetical protein